jgi:hypothetical protein
MDSYWVCELDGEETQWLIADPDADLVISVTDDELKDLLARMWPAS